jgi:hypothetical protein
MDASTYKKRMRLAKLLLTGSVFAAILSLFLPWDRLDFFHSWGSKTNVTESRSTLLVMLDASLRISKYLGCSSYWNYTVARLALLLIGFSFLLAPVYTLWLSRSTLLKISWITLSTCLLVAFVVGWLRPEKSFSGLFQLMETHRHTQFLSGYYFAWAAVILHFVGLCLIPSAKSLEPVVPPP